MKAISLVKKWEELRLNVADHEFCMVYNIDIDKIIQLVLSDLREIEAIELMSDVEELDQYLYSYRINELEDETNEDYAKYLDEQARNEVGTSMVDALIRHDAPVTFRLKKRTRRQPSMIGDTYDEVTRYAVRQYVGLAQTIKKA